MTLLTALALTVPLKSAGIVNIKDFLCGESLFSITRVLSSPLFLSLNVTSMLPIPELCSPSSTTISSCASPLANSLYSKLPPSLIMFLPFKLSPVTFGTELSMKLESSAILLVLPA